MKKYYLQFITILLLLVLAVLLFLCSDYFRSLRNNSSDDSLNHSVTPIAGDINDLTDDGTSSGSESSDASVITADPAELIDSTGSNPHSAIFSSITLGTAITTNGIDYSNYANGLSVIDSEEGTLSFLYDGNFSYTTKDGSAQTYHIADYVDLSEYFSGNTKEDTADWFFIGALSTSEYVYVQYDYWGKDDLSLYLRMKKNGTEIVLVYAAFYGTPEQEAVFTATNEKLYYAYFSYDVDTGAIESSLLQADIDGNNSGLLLSFPDGYSLHHLVPCEDYLLFMLTDSSGVTSLLKLNTLTLELAYVMDVCSVSDYLYVYKNYAIVGVASSKLIIYDVETIAHMDIPLSTKVTDPQYGQPICSEEHAYLPVFTLNGTSTTELIELFPEKSKHSKLIPINDQFYYMVGITDDYLYAEDQDGYITFPLSLVQ